MSGAGATYTARVLERQRDGSVGPNAEARVLKGGVREAMAKGKLGLDLVLIVPSGIATCEGTSREHGACSQPSLSSLPIANQQLFIVVSFRLIV